MIKRSRAMEDIEYDPEEDDKISRSLVMGKIGGKGMQGKSFKAQRIISPEDEEESFFTRGEGFNEIEVKSFETRGPSRIKQVEHNSSL
jgi:hypothetical protein